MFGRGATHVVPCFLSRISCLHQVDLRLRRRMIDVCRHFEPFHHCWRRFYTFFICHKLLLEAVT